MTRPILPVRRRAVTCNTHVGQAIYSGGLAWLIDETDPDVVLLSEVQRRKAKRAARRVLPRKHWMMFGPKRSSNAGTYVFVARHQFKRRRLVDRFITRGRSGFWPTRRLSVAVLEDRCTGRRFFVSSLHAWALLRASLTDRTHVVDQHRKQVQTFAEFHGRAADRHPEAVQLCGGDFNERLGGHGMNRDERRLSAVTAFREAADMRPAFELAEAGHREVRLDDVFVNRAPFVSVVDRRVIRDLPGRGDDHWSVVVDIDVLPLPTTKD